MAVLVSRLKKKDFNILVLKLNEIVKAQHTPTFKLIVYTPFSFAKKNNKKDAGSNLVLQNKLYIRL